MMFVKRLTADYIATELNLFIPGLPECRQSLATLWAWCDQTHFKPGGDADWRTS